MARGSARPELGHGTRPVALASRGPSVPGTDALRAAPGPGARSPTRARLPPLPASRRARPGPLPPLLVRPAALARPGATCSATARPQHARPTRVRGVTRPQTWRARFSHPRRGPGVVRPQPLLPGVVRHAACGARPCV
jgi:hypothetical protein